jgi:KDO2-lipid IV(A) lauroyltransferase
MNNLLIAFPEKTEKERIAIAKKFYKNLMDMFIETIKMLSVSDKFLMKRIKGNWDVVNAIYPTGKSVQVHLGHNFNWEWGNTVFVKETPFKLLAVYMPIANKIFEKLFYKLRTRNGAIFLRATHMKEEFLPYRNSQYLLGLIADQNPGHPGNAWWFNFFGRPTPFLKGPAKAAIVNDTAVVFAFIHKPRRGYYEAVFKLAEENPASSTEEELTKKFVLYMEDVIRQYPESWLWSHRRWKWEWKEEYGQIIN